MSSGPGSGIGFKHHKSTPGLTIISKPQSGIKQKLLKIQVMENHKIDSII